MRLRTSLHLPPVWVPDDLGEVRHWTIAAELD